MVRHRRMLAVINSIKHYVHFSQAVIVSGVIQNNVLVDTVSVSAAGAASTDVEEGAVVKAVYVEFWILNDGAETVVTQFTLSIEKLPTGNPLMTFTQSQNMGAYPNKKNVLYVTQGLIGSRTVMAPLPVFRTWVLIPKGKQRFGLGDRVVCNISNISGAAGLTRCGISTYKEYK